MWELIAAGVLTLGGVALGGGLQHWSSRSTLTAQLQEGQRSELHARLVDLIVDTREKVDVAWSLLPGFAKMQIEDFTEFMDTDSGKAMREREARLGRSRAELVLLLGEGSLRDAFLTLDGCLIDWPEKAMEPVMRHGGKDVDRVIEGFAHVKATQVALTLLEQEASKVVSVSLA